MNGVMLRCGGCGRHYRVTAESLAGIPLDGRQAWRAKIRGKLPSGHDVQILAVVAADCDLCYECNVRALRQFLNAPQNEPPEFLGYCEDPDDCG